MADPSLLSAELEADEEEEAALRRLLLQVAPDPEEAPSAGPARAVTPQPGTWGSGGFWGTLLDFGAFSAAS